MNSNGTKSSWHKAWCGRFEKQNAPLMERFNASIAVDLRLWSADLRGNRSWARGLHQLGILTAAELAQIEAGLEQIAQEFLAEAFVVLPTDEDIHMAVERRLTELIGEPAAKLHTGRSRNDQVVTDFRLFLKDEIIAVQKLVQSLQATLIEVAERHQQLIVPGYTHLQPAQPILLAHYLLSLFFALQRDRARLADCWQRVDVMPLGAGALAGSAFPIDREFLGRDLGFGKISENSIDAVADRDFVVEAVSTLTLLQVHLSRYAEDFIIWSSQEFAFIELDDAWATGSSMMPQKKNPDSLELIRGKAAKLIGSQTQLLTLLKGLPLTYAKDLQEDKAITFESIDTVKDSLQVFQGVIQTMQFRTANIEKRLDSFLFATDLADYLVEKGVPFRTSHQIVGQLVRWALAHNQSLEKIPFERFREASSLFEEDVYALFDWQRSLAKRNLPGGTGPDSVRMQIQQAKQLLAMAK